MSSRTLVPRKKIVIASIAALIAVISVVALAMPGAATRPNPGTVKVHDDATADPEQQNEPKVSCDFWIQGFGMEGDNGTIMFQQMSPPDVIVTPTGASLNWTADANGDFLNGPYLLPDGHYKMTVSSIDDKDKSKVFMVVDPCVPPTTTTSEVPFFPSMTALALGTVGALGGALLMLRRRN